MECKEIYEKIRDHAFTMRRSIENSARNMQFIEMMKNVLFNNLDDIEEALKYAADAEDQIHLLSVELDDADAELAEKDKEIAELKAALAKKTPKGKKQDVE